MLQLRGLQVSPLAHLLAQGLVEERVARLVGPAYLALQLPSEPTHHQAPASTHRSTHAEKLEDDLGALRAETKKLEQTHQTLRAELEAQTAQSKDRTVAAVAEETATKAASDRARADQV